jgi:hypothetical protein
MFRTLNTAWYSTPSIRGDIQKPPHVAFSTLHTAWNSAPSMPRDFILHATLEFNPLNADSGASSLNAEEKAVIPTAVNTGRKIPLQQPGLSLHL